MPQHDATALSTHDAPARPGHTRSVPVTLGLSHVGSALGSETDLDGQLSISHGDDGAVELHIDLGTALWRIRIPERNDGAYVSGAMAIFSLPLPAVTP